MAQNDEIWMQAPRRIGWFTLAFGFLAASAAYFARSHRAGLGIALGAMLAWVNYRWLDQGLAALVSVATARPGSAQARVPARVYWQFAGRYALIGLAAYVIVRYFGLPLLPLIVGLLALGAGAMAESLYELALGSEQKHE